MTPCSQSILELIPQHDCEIHKDVVVLDRNTAISSWVSRRFSKAELVLTHVLAWARKLSQAWTLRHPVPTHEIRGWVVSAIANFCRRSLNYLGRKLSQFIERVFLSRLCIDAVNPAQFVADLMLAARHLGYKPDVVLNMYLDCYSDDLDKWGRLANFQPKLYTGIHLDINNTLKSRAYEGESRMGTIFYINEDLLPPDVNANKPNKSAASSYVWIPDVATNVTPTLRSQLVTDVLGRARARKIVFLGGAIGGTKNLAAWYQTIALADKDTWFFLQVGVLDRLTLSQEDEQELDRFNAASPENVMVLNQYVDSELEFNELVSICDVVWALYRNFDRSSNILGKAAAFKKPAVVSRNYLLGERVKEFGIGMPTSENNPIEILAALTTLAQTPLPRKNYERYSQVHGTQALAKILKTTFESIP